MHRNRRFLAGLLALAVCHAGAAFAQDPSPARAPDPGAILGQALVAHRGPHPKTPPKTLWFKGSVEQISDKRDKNEANVEQWFVRQGERTSITTRIAVADIAGGERVSIRGFDGKRHFLIIDGKKTIIDGNPTYEKDQASIRQDLALTGFLIDNFLVGKLLGPDAKLEYLEHGSRFGLNYHKIRHTASDGRITVFYVNARPGEMPYFLGIEFPKTEDRPKINYCLGNLRDFGTVRLHQEIRIHEDDSKDYVMKVWIADLAVDRKDPPVWVPTRRG